uniref:Uncharacterized protein n=1 Tax=Magallana gigas TaxID=29159 RepID=A0A8W8HXP9_MAGGI
MGLAWFKDKVEKVVTRKAATSSAPVHDENEAQTKRRYNLRKRKGQDENAVTETKTSSILTPALKRRVRSPPKGKHESSRKTNPSSQKKRKAARVKRSTPEEKLQIRTQRSKKERCCKELPGMFAETFLKKLDLVSCINEGNSSTIHGISVTHDNLVWVNYLSSKQVKLYNSAGELLRSFDLDYHPVFNSCMPNGDLLIALEMGASTLAVLGALYTVPWL